MLKLVKPPVAISHFFKSLNLLTVRRLFLCSFRIRVQKPPVAIIFFLRSCFKDRFINSYKVIFALFRVAIDIYVL